MKAAFAIVCLLLVAAAFVSAKRCKLLNSFKVITALYLNCFKAC